MIKKVYNATLKKCLRWEMDKLLFSLDPVSKFSDGSWFWVTYMTVSVFPWTLLGLAFNANILTAVFWIASTIFIGITSQPLWKEVREEYIQRGTENLKFFRHLWVDKYHMQEELFDGMFEPIEAISKGFADKFLNHKLQCEKIGEICA